MLNNKLKKEYSSDLESKASGEDKKSRCKMKEIEDFYKNRQEKVLILKEAQRYINSIENMPEELITSVENIDMNIKAYEEVIDSNESISIPEIITKFGIVAGVNISAFGKPALKKIVATFGKASTGRKISSLHGVTRTNAILACLGGGSLDSGGKGMEGGNDVLKLCMPVGLTVTGISIVSGLLLHWNKNNKIGNEVEKIMATSNEDIEILGAKVSEILLNIKEYEIKDFNELLNVDDLEVIKKKEELKSLIDASESLAIKLNEKI